MTKLTKLQKVLIGIVLACGLASILVGVSHGATIKIDRVYTFQWQHDWNKINPGYKLSSMACWTSSSPKYKNCLFVLKRSTDHKTVCGEMTVDAKYRHNQVGVNTAVEGVTQYTCPSIISNIKKYLSVGRFVA